MMENRFAIQRIIKDITNEDIRVQVIGYVKKIFDDGSFILDDKTGDIKINLKDVSFNLNESNLVNVIGVLNITVEGEKEIEADIIQDMNHLNFEYYQKIYEIKKNL